MARKKVDKVAAQQATNSKKPWPRKQLENQSGYLQDNKEHFVSFRKQLAVLNLALRDVPGDGNCLFRALGDQLHGHVAGHDQLRTQTVKYMLEHRADFEPFVDDMPFEKYIDELSKLGTYAGQDCLVAFARLNKVNIVIHQLNSPMWQIEGGPPGCPELHLSYHNGEHYSSVRKLGDVSNDPAYVCLSPNVKQVAGSSASFIPARRSKNDKGCVGGSANSSTASTNKRSPPSSPRLPGLVAEMDLNLADWIPPEADGTVRAIRNMDDIVRFISDNTGCGDDALIEQTLEEHMYNTEATIDYLLNLLVLTQSHGPSASSGEGGAGHPRAGGSPPKGINGSSRAGSARGTQQRLSPPVCDGNIKQPITHFANSNNNNNNNSSTNLDMIDANGSQEQPQPGGEGVIMATPTENDGGRRVGENIGARPRDPNIVSLRNTAKRLTNRQRKDLHRKEKSQRQADRRGKASDLDQVSSDESSCLVASFGCLNL